LFEEGEQDHKLGKKKMQITAVCYKKGSKRLKVSKKFIYIIG
jgi:hypothetical protein